MALGHTTIRRRFDCPVKEIPRRIEPGQRPSVRLFWTRVEQQRGRGVEGKSGGGRGESGEPEVAGVRKYWGLLARRPRPAGRSGIPISGAWIGESADGGARWAQGEREKSALYKARARLRERGAERRRHAREAVSIGGPLAIAGASLRSSPGHPTACSYVEADADIGEDQVGPLRSACRDMPKKA